MAYSNFTTNQLQREYGLRIARQAALFADVPPVPISEFLRETLRRRTEFALRSGSEKARSEYIIAPIVTEAYDQQQDRANLFSGVEFKVDEARGLSGFCDFIYTLAPLAIDIQAPVISVVEAKKEDIRSGIPQCLAELVAAQIYNAAEGLTLPVLYGVITNGVEWKFLKLEGTNATIDADEYLMSAPEKIVGIIVSMLR